MRVLDKFSCVQFLRRFELPPVVFPSIEGYEKHWMIWIRNSVLPLFTTKMSALFRVSASNCHRISTLLTCALMVTTNLNSLSYSRTSCTRTRWYVLAHVRCWAVKDGRLSVFSAGAPHGCTLLCYTTIICNVKTTTIGQLSRIRCHFPLNLNMKCFSNLANLHLCDELVRVIVLSAVSPLLTS